MCIYIIYFYISYVSYIKCNFGGVSPPKNWAMNPAKNCHRHCFCSMFGGGHILSVFHPQPISDSANLQENFGQWSDIKFQGPG